MVFGGLITGPMQPKVKHHWLRKYLPGTPARILPLRRTQLALINEELPRLDAWSWRITPYSGWIYFMTPFIVFHFWLNWYNSSEPDDSQVFVDNMTPAERIEFNKQKDPNRLAWPLLHKYVTEMREGKRPLDDLGKLWKQTQYYYSGDWLVPIEMTQILKYSTGKLLAQYVDDPEQMRKDLLLQLINVRYGRVRSPERVSDEVKDIIAIACDDLAALSFEDKEHIPLVPTHSARKTGASDSLA